jgi:hypothetical protein
MLVVVTVVQVMVVTEGRRRRWIGFQIRKSDEQEKQEEKMIGGSRRETKKVEVL